MTNDPNLLSYVGLAGASLVGAVIGAYAKRKGENLATHEDLDKLVAQMAAVTETAENIKAAISDDLWDRQKQWEMRRDAVFEAVRTLGQLDNALLELHVAYSVSTSRDDFVAQNRLEKGDSFNTIGSNLDGARFLADAIVGRPLGKALSDCVFGMRMVAKDIMHGDAGRYTATQRERAIQILAVYAAVRRELKLENAG